MTDHPTYAEIIRRRVNIDFGSAKVSGWHPSSKEFESRMNALSFVFPAGEKFFIESVQYYLNRITDPVLKEQARRFIYQEAMHSKEHDRSNRELAAVHSYGSEMERVCEAVLNFGRRTSPRATQLAITCALEHFTAMLADGLLRNQDWLLSESDSAFAALWLWHAVEETEHKAVCFDVYQHVCGKGVFSYLHRVAVMFSTSLLFVATLGVGFMLIKRKQRREPQPEPTVAPSDTPPDQPSPGAPKMSFFLRDISMKLYFDYYRPSYHPWDHKNAHLIAEWKKRYTGVEPDQPAALSDASKWFRVS